MHAVQAIEILKEALLLEQRGHTFYHQVASRVANPDVAEFFETMAAEEQRHIQVLKKQMRSMSEDQRWTGLDPEDTESTPLADMILSDETKSRIGGADFEAAAISAAMLMEEKAVELYSSRAKAARDSDEKRLFQWLADWEQGHLTFLVALDRDIRTRIWNDNQFWPF